MASDLMTVQEAAVRLRMHNSSIYGRIAAGLLNTHGEKVGVYGKNAVLVSLAEVTEMARRGRLGVFRDEPEQPPPPPEDWVSPSEVMTYRTGVKVHTSPIALALTQSDLRELVRRRAKLAA